MVNSIGSSGGGNPVDAEAADGTLVERDLDALVAGTNLDWVRNENGQVVLTATDTQSADTHIELQTTDGTTVLADPDALRAGENLSVTDNADGTVTLSATDTDTDTHVELRAADGTTVLAEPTALLAGDNLSLTDNDDGTATLNSTSAGFTTADKQAMTTHPVPMTELAAGDFVDFPVHVPSGKTLKVWKWGARTDDQTTPAGLTVGLYNFAGATYLASTETAHETGAPLASFDGAGDVAVRVENTTGGKVNAGADFSVTVE